MGMGWVESRREEMGFINSFRSSRLTAGVTSDSPTTSCSSFTADS